MTDIDTLVDRVQERCAVPVERSTVECFLRDIVADFELDTDHLVAQTVEHFETQYVEEGGVIVEWQGNHGAGSPGPEEGFQ